MLKVAFVGWRGLVGSVLMRCMKEVKDFDQIDPYFFSTQTGDKAPKHPLDDKAKLFSSYDLGTLKKSDVIVSCQGSSYTQKVYYDLREQGWNGYWLDAASHLRRKPESTLVLDPVNGDQIKTALATGKKDFIGSNCTVSLMLLGIHGLVQENLVEWIHAATYQAVSGAGSEAIKTLISDNKHMSESLEREMAGAHLLDQMDFIHNQFKDKNPGEKNLASNILPWIDQEKSSGQTLEEAKGFFETNKILAAAHEIPVDGTCVRVPVLRSHSQVLTLKLKEGMEVSTIERTLAKANPWVKIISNEREKTLTHLNPLCSSSSFDIYVGRVRKLNLPGNLYEIFTVGDQLLWGASEPIRRALKMIVDYSKTTSPFT